MDEEIKENVGKEVEEKPKNKRTSLGETVKVSRDKNLEMVNAEQYKKENIKEDVQNVRHVSHPSGEKTKIIRRIKYKNGVVKNSLVGTAKDSFIKIDKGIDKKIIKDLNLQYTKKG